MANTKNKKNKKNKNKNKNKILLVCRCHESGLGLETDSNSTTIRRHHLDLYSNGADDYGCLQGGFCYEDILRLISRNEKQNKITSFPLDLPPTRHVTECVMLWRLADSFLEDNELIFEIMSCLFNNAHHKFTTCFLSEIDTDKKNGAADHAYPFIWKPDNDNDENKILVPERIIKLVTSAILVDNGKDPLKGYEGVCICKCSTTKRTRDEYSIPFFVVSGLDYNHNYFRENKNKNNRHLFSGRFKISSVEKLITIYLF